MSATSAPGWVVEVLGDGTGPRHRRYIVGASDRDYAIAAVLQLLGPNTIITSSSRVSIDALGISNVQPGEVIPL
jgi:hypothetical protein